MFRILVVDDEDVIRRGIVAILKSGLDTDICFLEAENGLEAMKLCKEHLPEIVITDIRMPFCDGLNLINGVTEAGYFPTFIIISGHADFEYAQSAIKLGVKEYLLKPIKKQELVTMVEGYVKKLRSEEQRLKEKFARESTNKIVTEKIKQKLLKNLLDSTNIHESQRILGELSDLGVNFNKTLVQCATIQYQVYEENKDYIDFAVKNIADEVLEQEAQMNFLLTVQYDSCRIVALFEGVEREEMQLSAKQVLSKVGSMIRKYLRVDVFIGIGNAVYGATLLSKSFKNSCEAANFKLYDTVKSVLLFSEILDGIKCDTMDFNDLIEPLECIRSAEIITNFEKLICLPRTLQSMSAIEQSYNQLIEAIDNKLVKYNFSETASLVKPPVFYKLWSFMELKQEVIKYLKQVCELSSAARIDVSNKKLIVEVLRYVKENAAEDINLNIVAEYFDRTPAYMSMLFKKGTGNGFNEYLTGLRMEMAKEMLSDTSIPIHEVSRLCGYSNSKYFSVVFKSTFGENPTTYRQNSMR